VRNTGGRRGSEVIQAYAQRVGSSRPERLVAFRRVELTPGQSTVIELTVDRSTLAERDIGSHAMVVQPGNYEVRVARHACDAGSAARVALV
jgi:beta-glucosidase